MNRIELERQLRWLMTLRVVIVTTMLVSAFAIELLFSPAQSLRPVFLLAAVSFGMVLLYAVLDHWLKGTRTFTYVQLVGDALVVTLFVHITGGLDSPMSFLYLLPIAAAALVLYRPGALILAGVCFAAYAGLILFDEARALIGSGQVGVFARDPGRVVYFLVTHLVAMNAVALLSAYLSERLKLQGRELAERRGAVVRLQALNENIIESINSGLITTGLDGRIHFINRGGAEITGLGQAEIEGRPAEELLQMGPGFLREIGNRLLAERRFRFERHFERGDGTRIFLGVAASNLYDKTGKPLGYIFIFQDLTEIHALEQEVRLKERMAALGEMAAGMAHELRNPLAAISGAVQYLKGDLQPGGETEDLMDIILRESTRLDQAIRDFLTFTRPGPFAPQRTDLVRLLEDNLKLLRKSREFREDHRIVPSYEEPRMFCDVDPNRLKQVFWNLAINALKAMPAGGTLAVRVKWAGNGVEIEFDDDGVGMDERQRQLYFQPFASSFREGTGLGAAIVYRLVEEHGGRIHLESNVGRGTSVRIELPRRQGGVEVDAPSRLRAAGGER
jgi:two-component system sensor histidine kinase PilS (NtrC family)